MATPIHMPGRVHTCTSVHMQEHMYVPMYACMQPSCSHTHIQAYTPQPLMHEGSCAHTQEHRQTYMKPSSNLHHIHEIRLHPTNRVSRGNGTLRLLLSIMVPGAVLVCLSLTVLQEGTSCSSWHLWYHLSLTGPGGGHFQILLSFTCSGWALSVSPVTHLAREVTSFSCHQCLLIREVQPPHV